MGTTLLPAARQAFWLALALGILSFLVALVTPVAGALQMLVWLAVAWGIRRAQWGAAALGAALMAGSTMFTVVHAWPGGAGPSIAAAVVAVLFTSLCGLGFLRGAIALREIHAVPWPWAGLAAAAFVYMICFTPYSTPSGSMEKTLLRGDTLLVERASVHLGRAPRVGDLVVFHYPVDRNQIFIKRVVGVPGDRVLLVNKQLFRNGTAVDEPYAVHASTFIDPYRDNFPAQPNSPLPTAAMAMLRDNVQNVEVVVPPGNYFVLGDNRDDSFDSRYWGFITASDMLGRPVLIYASYDMDRNDIASAFNTRWKRLLKPL